MKGALASLARRRAISVLPTPVGPIIRMFLGITSSRNGPSSCLRRQRLRNAMATARLASFCPTIWRSSSETISRGEKSVMDNSASDNRQILGDGCGNDGHHGAARFVPADAEQDDAGADQEERDPYCVLLAAETGEGIDHGAAQISERGDEQRPAVDDE